jgi:hypothetical protein
LNTHKLYAAASNKGQTQCIEAPTQGGVWGGII